MKKKMKYIYGPVYSWRLGMSLGVDPISQKQKVCNFDCSYCQLGATGRLSNVRRNFVPVRDVLDEISQIPSGGVHFITFSGRGEPTLAKNLGEMIRGIKKVRKEKIAVITNGALVWRADVQRDLCLADFLIIKLDAPDVRGLRLVNRPVRAVIFDKIMRGVKSLKKKFKGKIALQMMFISDNKEDATRLARIAKLIQPDEVQINTPLRPCAQKPLTRQEMQGIRKAFKGLKVTSVYARALKNFHPFDREKTIIRHGYFKEGKSQD